MEQQVSMETDELETAIPVEFRSINDSTNPNISINNKNSSDELITDVYEKSKVEDSVCVNNKDALEIDTNCSRLDENSNPDETSTNQIETQQKNVEGLEEPEQDQLEMESTKKTDYTCLNYNWSVVPRLLCVATEEYQPSDSYENFTKGCSWSPDGTCLLVPAEDFRIRIYELPQELYSAKIPSDFTTINFKPVLTIKEGGLIYDTSWYPFMNSWDPATCCFLSTSRESPAHLWDAFTGNLRATYRAYNQVDEVEAAISVQFINTGKEVWCGFKNVLRVFDTDRPGRQIYDIHLKKDFPNASGLISCIRENPVMPGLVAFGTYSKCIGLYKDGPLCTFKAGSGVTQVEFSPCGTKLYSAVRRNNEFLCWDLRNPGIILYSLEGRQSDTNQRIQFSLTYNGGEIISGGTDGAVSVWELPECTCDEESLAPKSRIKLSQDCINGVSLHRSLPILATSSGQRLCDIDAKDRDNSVRLWWFS